MPLQNDFVPIMKLAQKIGREGVAFKEADLPWERIGRKPRLPCMQAASQGRSYRHQGSSYALNKVMATDVVFKGFLWDYTVVIVRCPKLATKGFNQFQRLLRKSQTERNLLDPQRFNFDTKYSIHLLVGISIVNS